VGTSVDLGSLDSDSLGLGPLGLCSLDLDPGSLDLDPGSLDSDSLGQQIEKS
ncbi:7097_t:CDS:2, partial [Racocetra fulgida]